MIPPHAAEPPSSEEVTLYYDELRIVVMDSKWQKKGNTDCSANLYFNGSDMRSKDLCSPFSSSPTPSSRNQAPALTQPTLPISHQASNPPK
jgi:hypothetical protein